MNSEQLEREFPAISSVLEGERVDPRYEYRAVSVFDAWLGDDRLAELDCKGEAFVARRQPLNLFNAQLVKSTRVLQLHEESSARFEARAFDSKESALRYATQSGEECSSDSFFRLVLPDWSALYLESWDFTNVFYFRDRSRLEALGALARECGVHVLERNW